MFYSLYTPFQDKWILLDTNIKHDEVVVDVFKHLLSEVPAQSINFPQGVHLHGRDLYSGVCHIAIPSGIILYEEADSYD